jgi:hypothetical protein
MNQAAKSGLPWRDYFVLPTLGLLAAVLFLGSVEFAARTIWPKNSVDSCLVRDSAGMHYKAGCASRTKIPEGAWVENHYNDCGLQSGFPCHPKPAGDLRIAILGSSAAVGYMVPYETSYGARLERILSQKCGRTVEVQNLAVAGMHLNEVARRTDEAIALQPDLVLIVLTPYDLWKEIADGPVGDASPAAPSSGVKRSVSLRERIEPLKESIRESSALLMLRHYLYRDPQTYLNFFLMNNKGAADFLNPSLPPQWRRAYAHLDALLGDMAGKIHAQGIAFGVVPSFHRPQVALMNAREAFPGKDPYAFEREIAVIAKTHGMVDLEVTGDFQRAAGQENLFYFADGHLQPQGHGVLADALSRQILQTQALKQAGCPATPISDLLAVR